MNETIKFSELDSIATADNEQYIHVFDTLNNYKLKVGDFKPGEGGSYTEGEGILIDSNNAISASFGTGATNVARGNDSRINNGQKSFSWGDHADAGYATEQWVQSQNYLTQHQSLAGLEETANKRTTLANANNTTYPTTLAVKDAIESIPGGGGDSKFLEIENLIQNGDFKTPEIVWTIPTSAGTLTIVDGNLKSTGSGGDPSLVMASDSITINEGDKYYLRFEVRATTDKVTRIDYGVSGNFSTIVNPNEGEWITVEEILTRDRDGAFVIIARHASAVNAIDSGLEFNGDVGMILINLTEVFGTDHEPNKTTVEGIIKITPDNFFNGDLENKYYETYLLEDAEKGQIKNISNTLYNVQSNPNFENGTIGWSVFRGSFVEGTEHFTIKGNGIASFYSLRSTTPLNLNSLYYVQIRARVTNSECLSLRLAVNQSAISIPNPEKDKWYTIQGYIDTSAGGVLGLESTYGNSNTLDKETEVDREWGFVAINLTETYGKGNEPTLDRILYLANSLPLKRIPNELYLEDKFYELRSNDGEDLKKMTNLFHELLDVQDSLTENLSWELVKNYFKPPIQYENRYGEYPDPLVFYNNDPVTNAAEWELRKTEIKDTWMGIIGEWPPLMTDQEFTIISTIDKGDYLEHKVSFEWIPNQVTEGYLLVPNCGCDGGGLLPASISVYYEPETSIGDTVRGFAQQLVRKGFISLAIGEGFSYFNNWLYPDSTSPTMQPLSLRAYAAANAWHALSNFANVDSEKIGIVGHSYGGKWAQFASCLFDKFALGVWSDGGVTLDSSDYDIAYYLGAETVDYPNGAWEYLKNNGHDFSELHALMDGRPFLVTAGGADSEERWTSLNYNVRAFEFLGYDKSVALTMRSGHPPTYESTRQQVKFFEHFLKFKGVKYAE